MGFSKQEYWSGLPFPSPGDLPDSGIEPGSPTLQADPLPSEPPGTFKTRNWERFNIYLQPIYVGSVLGTLHFHLILIRIQ